MRFDACMSVATPPRSRVREEQEGLLQPVGVEDFEDVECDRLQGVLSQFIGLDEVRRLGTRLAADADWNGMTRLTELRDPGTCHDWLRSIGPHYGSSLSASESSDAIRGRLGIAFIAPDEECRR